MTKLERLQELARKTGYQVNHRPYNKHGDHSSKPYQLAYDDGGHISSFRELLDLEYNLRGRNGC